MTVGEFRVLLENFNNKYMDYAGNVGNLEYAKSFEKDLVERNKYANNLMEQFCNLSKNTMLDFQNDYMYGEKDSFMDFTFKQNHKMIECIGMELLLPEVRKHLGCESFTNETILKEKVSK